MPRRAPTGPMISSSRLVIAHAHLRADAEGVPVPESAQALSRHQHGNQALSPHPLPVEQVAVVATRAADPRWRLVKLRIEKLAGVRSATHAYARTTYLTPALPGRGDA